MKLKQFAFIIINTLYILIHFMIICFIINMHCKRLLQIQNLHGVFTAWTRALTTRPRRSRRPHSVCHSVLSNTLWKRQDAAFVLSMLKVNAAAWRSRRLHSVCTAFARRCWHLHSAHLGVLQFVGTLWERCKDATLVWQGFNICYLLFYSSGENNRMWNVILTGSCISNLHLHSLKTFSG